MGGRKWEEVGGSGRKWEEGKEKEREIDVGKAIKDRGRERKRVGGSGKR